MKKMKSKVIAFIIVVAMLVVGCVVPAFSAEVESQFSLDMTTKINAEDSSVIDVVITVNDIKQELYSVEFLLNYDDEVVEGVYKENNNAEMDVFMTKTPMYTLSYGNIQLPASRYEQICYYDAENSRYEMRFCDLLSYPLDKGGVEYKGLIEDGELVITVPFKILSGTAADAEFAFSAVDVKGTAKEGLTSVPGTGDSVVHNESPSQAQEGYYLVGTLNGGSYWYVDNNSADRMLKANPNANGEYMIDWTFSANDEIKVVYFDGTGIKTWYKDNADNYKISSGEVGNCTIYFRPEGNSSWAYTYFYVAPNTQPTVPTDPAPEDTAFAFDVATVKNAKDESIIDVVITIKDIEQELVAVEFLLNFDDTLVEGVYKENLNSEMDVFMTTVPTYILKQGIIEIPVPRYEQICYYDAENSRYEIRVCDLLSYPLDKGGVEYKGLLNDGELVLTIPFKILDGAKGDAQFTVAGVKGTTQGVLNSVTGVGDTATYSIGKAELLLGDVNRDGTVNILDATVVQRYVALMQTLDDEQMIIADVNKDKSVNILDATQIQRYVAQFITKF